MSPDRFRECIALPGWSQRKLERYLGLHDRSVSKMSSGKREIAPELEEWLEAVAAAWAGLSPYLMDAARNMHCDRGRFVRYPHGFPLTDEEAAQLQAVADFHATRPQPNGWRATDPAALQDSVAEAYPAAVAPDHTPSG